MATYEALALGPWPYESEHEQPAQVALEWAGVTAVSVRRYGERWVVERVDDEETSVHDVISDLIAALQRIWEGRAGDNWTSPLKEDTDSTTNKRRND